MDLYELERSELDTEARSFARLCGWQCERHGEPMDKVEPGYPWMLRFSPGGYVSLRIRVTGSCGCLRIGGLHVA